MSMLSGFAKGVLLHPVTSMAHPQVALRGLQAKSRTEQYVDDMTHIQGIDLKTFKTLGEMLRSGQVSIAHTNKLEILRDDINRHLALDPDSVLTAFIQRSSGKILFFWWVSFSEDGGYKGLKKYWMGEDPESGWEMMDVEVEQSED